MWDWKRKVNQSLIKTPLKKSSTLSSRILFQHIKKKDEDNSPPSPLSPHQWVVLNIWIKHENHVICWASYKHIILLISHMMLYWHHWCWLWQILDKHTNIDMICSKWTSQASHSMWYCSEKSVLEKQINDSIYITNLITCLCCVIGSHGITLTHVTTSKILCLSIIFSRTCSTITAHSITGTWTGVTIWLICTTSCITVAITSEKTNYSIKFSVCGIWVILCFVWIGNPKIRIGLIHTKHKIIENYSRNIPYKIDFKLLQKK